MGEITLKNKRIIVTGGNGYLGRKLVDKLYSVGAQVYSLDIEHFDKTDYVNYVNIDLLNKSKLNDIINQINPTLVFHLAAIINRTRDFSLSERIFEVNFKGTINLLEALINIKYENFIFTSTSEVYGGNLSQPPYLESDPYIPASPYSLSKHCAEMSIKTYSQIYNKNYSIFRVFNFYGDDMPDDFFLSQLLERLRRDEDFDMTSGEQIRDFLHVNDVLNALLLSIKKEAYNEVFNISSNVGVSLKDLALKLKDELNSKSKINFGALPYRENEVWEMIGSNNKIKKLGFEIKYNLFGGEINA